MTRTIKSALLALFLLSVSSYGRTTRSANRRHGLSSNSRGTAGSRDLEYIYEKLGMVSSMSMPLESKKASKKGKKCKKDKSSKKGYKLKGKGKGMSSKGKGKGRSSKGKGKGKGKGRSSKGKICDAPTPPTSTISPSPGPAESMAPTSAIAPTGSPTGPPGSTQAPTIVEPLPTLTPTMGPVTVVLDLYALLYAVDAFRLPFQTEIDILVALTQGYLEDFFTVVFEASSLAELEGSTTVEDETIVRFGQPIQTRYFTDLTFSGTSQIPSDGELNGLLSSAFRGDNLAAYLAEVQALPESNIFAASTSVEFMDVSDNSSNSRSEPSSSGVPTVGIATAAGAGAFIVAVVGLMLYRRRDEDDEEDGKYLDNDGHLTVAGDTYQGGSSVDSQSGIHRTQQFGDAESSISPTEWGEEASSRKIEEEHVSSLPMAFEDSSESDSSEDYSFVESGDQQDSPHLDDVTL